LDKDLSITLSNFLIVWLWTYL